MLLTEQLRAASSRLQEDFSRRTRALGQNLDRGEAREGVVRAFLEEWLPRKYSVGRGEVVAAEGGHSRQMDVVIYDDINSPLIFRQTDSPQVVPIESVYGAIEVKSNLTYAELRSSIANLRSCLNLPRQQTEQRMGPISVSANYRPFTGVFAFSGAADADELLRVWGTELLTLTPLLRPNIVCVLGRGCLMFGSSETGWSLVSDELNLPIWVQCEEDALLMFYLSACAWMADAAALPVPNLMAYAGGALTFDVRIFNPG